MTNVELSASMQELARIYALQENAGLIHPSLSIVTSTKEELLAVVRAIGGKFTKSPGDYFMSFRSERLPGVSVLIPRDKVCRKIVTWDCEPLLSELDAEEVDKAALVTPGKVLEFPAPQEREKLAS